MRALQPAYSVSPSSILKCLLQTRRNQLKSGHSGHPGAPDTSLEVACGATYPTLFLPNTVAAQLGICIHIHDSGDGSLWPHGLIRAPRYRYTTWDDCGLKISGGFLPKHAHPEPCFHGQCGTRPMEFEKGFVTCWHTNVQRKSLPPSQ